MKPYVRRLIVLFGILWMPFALADEFRPALLEIEETQAGWYSITWKVPMQDGQPLAITPVLPDSLERIGPVASRIVQGAVVEESAFRAETGSLRGETITIDGLASVPIDVIVQISLADGAQHSGILRPASTSFEVPERASLTAVALSYWKIGTIHILEGFDHLLFVLALLLLVPNRWMLFKTITAFTVAHSISLALATLGVVNMPPGPTEAVIALSILFLAVEIIHKRQGKHCFTAQYPWVVAFAFGLFHGLGFAGALAEVGLPQQAIPLALLMFNVGVETGQIMFVSVVLLLMAVLNRLSWRWPRNSWRLAPYAIGSVAAFWTIQRIDTFI